jgi:hypothetical protein
MTPLKHTFGFAIAIVLTLSLVTGCKQETPSTAGSTAKKSDDTHVHDDGTVHTDSPPAAGHGGPVIELGTTTIGPFTVRASRDKGEIKAGGDAPIDVWLTGGDISKVTAVRFWIGTEQGDNFVKAKADIEIPSEPNHWHTHAEVPSPLPTGSKLWVEIEVGGQKSVGSFELKM